MLIKDKTKNTFVLLFVLSLIFGIFSQIQNTTYANHKTTDNAKSSAQTTTQPLNPFYSKTSNDLTAYLGRKDSNSPYVKYQKDDNYLEFSLNQPAQSVSLETNTKEPNTPTLFYRNIFDNTDIAYKITNLPFRVKEEIILNKFPISNDKNSKQENLTYTFSTQTNTLPVKQQDGSIHFYDKETNNYLFQLDKPFMYDAKGTISNDVTINIIPKDSKGKQKLGQFNDKLSISNVKSMTNDLKMTNQFQNPNVKDKILKFFNNWILPLNFDIGHSFDIGNLKLDIKPQEYQITLQADSKWLNDPNRSYPIVIDPTITHDESAEFNGQYNRIANASTTVVQLESSYPEATKDPHTVLLLHFNESNGATSGIKDYASTTRVITANGHASTTNYVTQLGMGNSLALDGTGDYLTAPASSDWAFGTGDFSVDFWIMPNVSQVWRALVSNRNGVNDNVWKIGLGYNSANKIDFHSGNTEILNGNSTLATSTWNHVAVIRSGGFIRLFINGLLDSSVSNSFDFSVSNTLGIGYDGTYNTVSAQPPNAYLDSLRILKGRALTPEEIKASASRRPYAVYTSSVLDATASVQWDTLNWTEGGVNTGDGEQPYNTNSLVAQWNFNDTSGTTLTASSSGSCTTSCNGTLTNFSYTSSQDQATTTTGWTANNKRWGNGALMFDGGNDWVDAGNTALNNPTAGTVEIWIKPTASGISGGAVYQNTTFLSKGATYTAFQQTSNNKIRIYLYDTGTVYRYLDSISSLQVSEWQLVTYSWDNSGSSLYINGKLNVASTTFTVANIHSDHLNSTFNIGRMGDGTYYFPGLIDSTRIYSRALSAAEILSNYQAGNVEIQTRTGATSDPNDGTWGAWTPTTGETQLLAMDSDQSNWNAPQQIDGYTKLLLHMDGTDAATTFPNSATTTHTVTANGNAQVDTAQSKFSGASGLFDGTGDYLSIPDSDDWNFGSGDFTMDWWWKFNAVGSNMHFIGQDESSSVYKWALNLDYTTLHFYAHNVGDFNYLAYYFLTNPWSPIAGTWYHMAVVRNGTSLKIYINGVSQTLSVNTPISNNTLGNNTGALTIGYAQGGRYLNGHLDEFRISKGIARWTSNFTPPPRPYGSNVKADNDTTIKQEGTGSTKLTLGAPQVDGNTVALWHFEETGTTTGTTLYDETANNNDATTTGTTVADGIFGKGRKFNGTSDYLSVPDSENWNFGSGDFSVDFWVRIKTNEIQASTIILQGADGAPASTWAIYHQTGGSGWSMLGLDSSAWSTNIISSNSKWEHVAFIKSGGTVTFYLNGVARATRSTTSVNYQTGYPLKIGRGGPGGFFFEGYLDSLRILKGRAISPDEIAETYRMGANHHLTRQVSATDLSSATKLPFYVAADRPGTYLEAMIGESDHANYELASSTLALSTTTVLYIKGDEIASSTAIKDSSFSGKAITANGNARTSGSGKIGNSVYFDGTGDYLSLADSSDWNFGSGDFSIDMWVKLNALQNSAFVNHANDANNQFIFWFNPTYGLFWHDTSASFSGSYDYMNVSQMSSAGWATDTWYHIAVIRNGNTFKLFKDGVLVGSGTSSHTMTNWTQNLKIGETYNGSYPLNGYLDSLRIIKGPALTPDQIRQAYEYGLRSHQITIDFGATLQTSDLISNSTDYNFSITATTSGLSATTSGLYLGDKIIIKENLGGTEYTAQGTVNSINTTTGAITVSSWDNGSTFPASNGYSPNATVFKWQREYFDLTGAATTTRNAITNLTLRPTNGAEGRTVYLDDFKYNTNYLTASSSSAITSSNNRYLQYRTIFTSWDPFVSPFISAVSTAYTSIANMFPPNIGVSGGGFLSF